ATAYYGRGLALILANDYARAIPDFEAYGRLQPEAPHGPFGRGLALWLSDRAAEAEAQFREAQRRAPDSNFYPPWVFIVQTRTGGDAAATLQAAAGRVKMEEWPGPVWQLYLGVGSPEAALESARSDNPRSHALRQVAAQYFVAMWYLAKA